MLILVLLDLLETSGQGTSRHISILYMTIYSRQSWGDIKKNDTLTEHIWSSLVQGKEDDIENTLAQADLENTVIP